MRVLVWALLGTLALCVLPVIALIFAGLIRRFQIWRTGRALRRMGFVGDAPSPAESRPIWRRVGIGVAVLVAVLAATSQLPGGPWGRTLASTDGVSLAAPTTHAPVVPPGPNDGSGHSSSQQPATTHSTASSAAAPASTAASPSSASSAADPGSDTGAPSTVTALAKSSTTIRVQWAPVTGATRYEIERSTDAVAWTPVARRNSDQTAYIDAALSSGTTYYYRVAAVDADANVSHSDVVSATTTGDASTAPVWISSTASDTSVDLAWSDVDGAVGYLIERSPDGTTGWATIGTTGQGVTTYTDSGLASATTYYYRVSALTSDGGSSYPSTSLAVTTQVAGPTTSDANALPSQAPTAP